MTENGGGDIVEADGSGISGRGHFTLPIFPVLVIFFFPFLSFPFNTQLSPLMSLLVLVLFAGGPSGFCTVVK